MHIFTVFSSASVTCSFKTESSFIVAGKGSTSFIFSAFLHGFPTSAFMMKLVTTESNITNYMTFEAWNEYPLYFENTFDIMRIPDTMLKSSNK